MAIQFKRGSYSNKVASTEILKAGQPFFEKTNKKLYIGDGSTQLKDLTAINNYTDTNQKISAAVGDTTKYFLSNATVNLKEGTDISFIVANNDTSTAPSLTINATPYTAGNSLTLLDHQFNVTIAENGGLEYSKGNDIKLKATTTAKTGTNNYDLKLNTDGTPYVNVPWTDTTYTGGNGISVAGGAISVNLASYGGLVCDSSSSGLLKLNVKAGDPDGNKYWVRIDENNHPYVNVSVPSSDNQTIAYARTIDSFDAPDIVTFSSDARVRLVPGNNISMTADTKKNYIKIDATDTTYTGGNGISVSGETISLAKGYDVPIEYKSSASSTAGFTSDKLYLIGTWTGV